MAHSITEQTLALAALFLAAHCVNKLAYDGQADSEDVATLINSLFKFDAENTRDIYTTEASLFTGYDVLTAQLKQSVNEVDINVTRIVITLLVLERKLKKNPGMLEDIAKGIERADKQAGHFDSHTHDNVLANLADVYSKTISTIQPKIMVNGEPGHLSNTDNVNKIRSLLLAGIRAAVLFHQLGGRRWQLIFKRKKFILAAEQLKKSITFH